MQLLIIDPQNDFCRKDGALSVPGADADMDRLARFLHHQRQHITGVTVSLDSHHRLDISHPLWFVDDAGNPPAPFTRVRASDVEAGRWHPTCDAGRTLRYLQALDARARYPHVIWPEHCLTGSEGQAILPILAEALWDWCGQRRYIDFVHKGTNPWTEHFSAVQAEVPDETDPSTQRNHALVARLEAADTILIAGEAGSHCVANTIRDLAAAFQDPASVRKLVLLTDTISPVPGFEALQEQFIADLCSMGMQRTTTRAF